MAAREILEYLQANSLQISDLQIRVVPDFGVSYVKTREAARGRREMIERLIGER